MWINDSESRIGKVNFDAVLCEAPELLFLGARARGTEHIVGSEREVWT